MWTYVFHLNYTSWWAWRSACLPHSPCALFFNQATLPKILQTQMVSLGSLIHSVTFLPFQLSAPRPCTPNQLPNHKLSGHAWSSDALPICLHCITCLLSVSTHFSNSDPHNFTLSTLNIMLTPIRQRLALVSPICSNNDIGDSDNY